ncbi:hypothetical protein AYI70_g172 [Smittium culicis]|uniref:Uncharacterized protein n=1 Tax=Smittium culicis TaxID=133412 RepID=A0A1R1YHR7_9FUNG|nr:hypothetical protein AYI70_g172 [Smittium culicis]
MPLLPHEHRHQLRTEMEKQRLPTKNPDILPSSAAAYRIALALAHKYLGPIKLARHPRYLVFQKPNLPDDHHHLQIL